MQILFRATNELLLVFLKFAAIFLEIYHCFGQEFETIRIALIAFVENTELL